MASGSGSGAACFRCPYHGWEYHLDGRLRKAVGLRGIEGFRSADNGLVPLRVATLGPWLFGHAGKVPHFKPWLGSEGARVVRGSGACREHVVHVARREYAVRSNWKVFCDNYLVRPRLRSLLSCSRLLCRVSCTMGFCLPARPSARQPACLTCHSHMPGPVASSALHA